MTKKRAFFILTVLYLFLTVLFYGKTGSMFVDFSRELQIPFDVSQGKLLFRDIFLIYGPFGYILNSFLFKISANINTLLIEAHIIAYFILILFYFIVLKFSSNLKALIFSIIFLFISIFSNSTFSFVLPYSYSTLWAVFGVYGALFCLLYNKKNLLFLLLGLIAVCKVEFFIPIFIISILYLILKKEKFLKHSFLVTLFPLFVFCYFILKGLKVDDFIGNSFYVSQLINSQSLKILYKSMGVFFETKYFALNLLISFEFLGIMALSYLFYKLDKKNLAYCVLVLFLFVNSNNAFSLCGFVLLLFLIYLNIKKKISLDENLISLFSISLCLKCFFAITALNYANFGFILLIFCLYLQLSKFLEKKWLLATFCFLFASNYILNLVNFFIYSKAPIETNKGIVYAVSDIVDNFRNVNLFIKENIKENESLVVVPEGGIFNFLNNKNYNFYNTTFTPLDFDTFGEKYLIEQIKTNKTDYVIFFPRNTLEYGLRTICLDYGIDFCKYINDNYVVVKRIMGKSESYICKRKYEK